MASYPLIPGTLSNNCWPADPQTLYNQMFSLGSVQLSLTGVVFSSTAPAVADRDKFWVKLDGGNLPTGQFRYASGQWIWPHPTTASSQERRLWIGSTVDLLTFDGGSNAVVSATTGPMWEVDTLFAARMPLAPGTLPVSSTAVAVGDTGGVEKVILATAETGAALNHYHGSGCCASGSDAKPVIRYWSGSASFSFASGASADSTCVSAGTSQISGAYGTTDGQVTAGAQVSTAHQNMPPYFGCYFIKRTARVFFVG